MYMTGDEIRALTRRIPEVINATDEELAFWMDEAFDIINNFCQQDFVYERQVTKRVRATTNTLVYLPKVLSGYVTVKDGGATIFTGSPTSGDAPSNLVELFPGQFVIGFHKYNQQYPSGPDAHTLYVTGDWGFFNSVEDFLVGSANTLKQLYEAHRVNTVVHNQSDTLNVVALADATDFDSAALLLNELKGVINSHFGDFVVHISPDSNVSTLPDVTNPTTALQVLDDLVRKFNTHIKSTSVHIEADNDNMYTTSTDADACVMPRVIRRVFLRLVQRLAIRDDAEDHRQINSPYTSETLGDNYTYELNNGTLRNLLRPEEAHMLIPYVNRGRVVI